MAITVDFDSAERAAIVAEYDRLAKEPTRPNITSMGCLMLILAVAIFLIFSRFAQHLPRAVNLFVMGLIVVLVVGGVLVYFFGSGGGYARAGRRANAALEILSQRFDTSTVEERRNAAVSMIFDAIYSDGPSSSSTYDFQKARTTLGPALAYIQAVERILLAERKPYPIFTLVPKPDTTDGQKN